MSGIVASIVDYDYESEEGDDDDCYESSFPSSCMEELSLIPSSSSSLLSSLSSSEAVVIVCNGTVTEIIRNYLIASLGLKKETEIKGLSSGNSFATVWSSLNNDDAVVSTSKVLLISFIERIPDILVSRMIRLITPMISLCRQKMMVILGSVPLVALVDNYQFTAQGPNAGIVLRAETSTPTSLFPETRIRELLAQTRELGVGNVLSGLNAGLLCLGEGRGWPSIACLTVSPHSSSVTAEAAKALEKALPLLHLLCGIEGPGEEGSTWLRKELYRDLQRRDGYAISTSNLYT